MAQKGITAIAELATLASTAVRNQGSPAFAAVDLGTNNCRMLVGARVHGGFRVLDSFSRIVRLGEDLHSTGRLSQVAMDRAMAALRACAARMTRRTIYRTRAIATEACRKASNGAEFLDCVRGETGLRFDVISSREEVELALESCAPLLKGDGRRALLFDIGGGSTELAWVRLARGQAPELIGTVSLPVGVVNLAERFGDAGFTPVGFEAMVAEAANRLAAFERVHCIGHEMRMGGVRMLGTSGTVTTLAGVALGLPRYRRMLVDGVVLSDGAAAGAVTALRQLGRDGMALHPCIGPERAEFVLPGCAVFEAIRRTWRGGDVLVADRGLREGMLLRMMRDRPERRAQGSAPRRLPS